MVMAVAAMLVGVMGAGAQPMGSPAQKMAATVIKEWPAGMITAIKSTGS